MSPAEGNTRYRFLFLASFEDFARADTETMRHQQIWNSFTNFVKYGTAAVLLLVVFLWFFLVV